MTSRRPDAELPSWDDKIGTIGPAHVSAASADDVSMTSATLRAPPHSPVPECSGAPRLRLLPKGEDARPPSGRTPARTRSTPATATADAPVLIAGRDAAVRGQLRTELTELMPAGTRFEELGALWELLARAPASRMVILSGELDELAPEELLHTLGHRHPDLPVVSLGARARG